MSDAGMDLLRGIALGAISGLKTTYGPALLAASRRSEGWQALAVAAMGEMIIDKMPMVPDRSRPALLIPRALAGFWAAKASADRPGQTRYDAEALGIALAGALAAAGVAYVSPTVRRWLGRTLGVPDMVIGVAEDVLALSAGAAVVGMHPSELLDLGTTAVDEARSGQLGPVARQLGRRLLPV